MVFTFWHLAIIHVIHGAPEVHRNKKINTSVTVCQHRADIRFYWELMYGNMIKGFDFTYKKLSLSNMSYKQWRWSQLQTWSWKNYEFSSQWGKSNFFSFLQIPNLVSVVSKWIGLCFRFRNLTKNEHNMLWMWIMQKWHFLFAKGICALQKKLNTRRKT